MARHEARGTNRSAASRGARQDRATGTREQMHGNSDVAPRQASNATSRSQPGGASRDEGAPRNEPDAGDERQDRAVGLWPGEYWTPQIETFQRGDALVVRADLPGLKPEEVTVEATDDMLAIHGERRRECEERREGYFRSERSYGSFDRRIHLPRGVDPAHITAQFKDGVLEVTMPAGATREHARARRIEVKGG